MDSGTEKNKKLHELSEDELMDFLNNNGNVPYGCLACISSEILRRCFTNGLKTLLKKTKENT